MRKCDNNSENIIKDNGISSFFNELCDVNINHASLIKVRIDDLTHNIQTIKDNISCLTKNDDENYNLFSPITKDINEHKNSLLSQLSILQHQYNEYIVEYNKINLQFNHISYIKNHINKLENVILSSTIQKESDDDFLITNKNKKDMVNCNLGIKLLKTQELERKRIARDLHDSTVQNLTNLIHKTEICSKYVDNDPIRTKLELEIMKRTIRTTINDMREIIYDLRPMLLDDLGLVTTVERYIEQISKNSGINIVLNMNNIEYECYPIINSTLFRIIQESCNNVIKHAMASNVQISLMYSKDSVILSIEDDGEGFDLVKYHEPLNNQNSNFGLSIMKERVDLLSGEIRIESEKYKGTKIYIKIPINLSTEENNDD